MPDKKTKLNPKITTSKDRKTIDSKTLVLAGIIIGVVIIGLAIATVVVATRNAKRAEVPVLASAATADPYYFMKTPTPASPTASPSAVVPEAGWIKTGDFGSSVKMRNQPNTDSESLTLVRDREPVQILSITDLQDDGYAWYKINYDQDTGYIRSDFLVFEEPEPLPEILFGKEIEDVISGETLYSKLDFVSRAAPGVRVDLTLAKNDNFIGKKMYSKDVALIQYGTGKKLDAAAKALDDQGYQLVLWDAYRPYSVSVDMYQYVNDPTLLADPKKGSKHNRGAAVDVTLYKNGNPLNMPTDDRIMDVDEASRGSYMTTEQHTLLDILTKAMEDAGFSTYYGEWWHFNDTDWESYPVMDYPLDMF